MLLDIDIDPSKSHQFELNIDITRHHRCIQVLIGLIASLICFDSVKGLGIVPCQINTALLEVEVEFGNWNGMKNRRGASDNRKLIVDSDS